MRFEVFNQLGDRVMWTEDVAAIPSEAQLKQITAAQYKIKLDGKLTTINAVMQLRSEKSEKSKSAKLQDKKLF